MLTFTLRRLNLFFFTMLALSMLSFSLCYLFPGDPVINLSGQINADESQLQTLIASYNFNHNFLSQYLAYLQHIINGDLGVSMTRQGSVYEEIFTLLPATIELSIAALFIAMLIGIPAGFIAAINHGKMIDNSILSFAVVGHSIPVFWLGLVSILVFSIQLGWLPSAGQLSLVFEIESLTGFQLIDIMLSDSPYQWQAFYDALSHLILPAFVIALAPTTIFIRLARNAMIEVLNQPYIKAAKAKGLSTSQIIYRHAIRNSLVGVIRHVGLQFANLMTLAMVTEVIFSWPGIGRWLIESIYQRDYTAIQGGLLALSTFIFLIHIITDFMYAAVNPLARDK